MFCVLFITYNHDKMSEKYTRLCGVYQLGFGLYYPAMAMDIRFNSQEIGFMRQVRCV